jgi:hypothetical protein
MAGEKRKLRPVLEGDSWLIGANPADLGRLQGNITPGENYKGQEVVDHHIWRDGKGNWRLWACIRKTAVGRLFYGWVSPELERSPWKPLGAMMRRNKTAGESLADRGGRFLGEVLQSPFVIRTNGRYYMFYGGGYADSGSYLKLSSICLAISEDGVSFSRHENRFGESVLFYGPGTARDPCLLEIGDTWHLYYAGNETGFPLHKHYVRTSSDLVNWSASREVVWGGTPGTHMSSTECPHVVRRQGYYYLFRTENYAKGRTYVYRSEDPYDFGLNDDKCLIGQIDVAAPEIIVDGDKEYISSNKHIVEGAHLFRLRWEPED